MIDLSVTFQGITFPNPFLVGSGPTTGNPPKIISAIRAGWGGVVVKTIGDSIVRKSVRPMYATIRRNREIIAFENLELITEDPLEVWDKYLRVIKSEIGKSAPIIVSIMGGPDYSEWIRLARWAEDRGADMLELNFGCPHGEPEKRTGAFIGQHADLVQEYTKEVVSSVGIPVIAKLTPNITDIRETAKAAENAGAKAVTAINTVNGVIAVDRAQPLPDINGYSGYGGISGPAVKPIGLAAVSKIYTSTSLQISGVGGIFDWRDAVEYIMMGATTVQSVTYTILKGFEFINEWKKELESFMERKGYRAIEDMRGLAAKKMTTYEVLEKVTKRRTSVDEEINTVRDETHG